MQCSPIVYITVIYLNVISWGLPIIIYIDIKVKFILNLIDYHLLTVQQTMQEDTFFVPFMKIFELPVW